MNKSQQLELKLIQSEDQDRSQMKRKNYSRMSTFITPRDVHQIFNNSEEKTMSGNTSVMSLHQVEKDEQKKSNRNDGEVKEKVQKFFDKKMQQDLKKTIGQPIKILSNSTKKDVGVNRIISHMQDCNKKCVMAKQIVYKEVKKIIKQENEEIIKHQSVSSQSQFRGSQNKMKTVLLTLPTQDYSKSKNSIFSSKSSIKDFERGKLIAKSNQSNVEFDHPDEYQIRARTQRQETSNQNKQVLRVQVNKDKVGLTSTISKSPKQNDTSQNEHVVSPNFLKRKSVFHKMYSKRGTLENSQLWEDPLDISAIEENQELAQPQQIKFFKGRFSNSRQQTFEEQSPINSSQGSFSTTAKEVKQRNQQLNFFNFGHRSQSRAMTPKNNNTSSHAIRLDLSNASSTVNDSPLLKKNWAPFNPKIQHLQQMNSIVTDVQEVCNDLIEDATLFQNSTFITKNLNNCLKLMDVKEQIWLNDPKFLHMKEKLKDQQLKRDLSTKNMHFHPYFQFLGYDRLDQIPRNRGRQEIIEQRYAYFLHRKGVEQAHQTIANITEIDIQPENIQQKRKQARITKMKNILKDCKFQQLKYRIEEEEKNTVQKQIQKRFISRISSISPISSRTKQQSKTTFIPLTPNEPKEGSRKFSIQKQYHHKTEETDNQQSETKRRLSKSNKLFKLQECNGLRKRQSDFLDNDRSVPQFSEQSINSEDSLVIPHNQKIGEINDVPIVRQVLTRYGRINNKESEDIIHKIQTWRKSEEDELAVDQQFIFDKLEEQKQNIAEKYKKMEKIVDSKKVQTLEKIRKKYSSKQKVTVEKIYQSEKQWEDALLEVEDTRENIDRIIQSARSRINSIKQTDSNDPVIRQLYKKSMIQTGMKFIDKYGQKIK